MHPAQGRRDCDNGAGPQRLAAGRWYVSDPYALDGARGDSQGHRQEMPGYSISEISFATRRYSPRAISSIGFSSSNASAIPSQYRRPHKAPMAAERDVYLGPLPRRVARQVLPVRPDSFALRSQLLIAQEPIVGLAQDVG